MKSAYISGIGDGVTLTAVQKSDPVATANSRTQSSAVDTATLALNERGNDCRPTSALVKR